MKVTIDDCHSAHKVMPLQSVMLFADVVQTLDMQLSSCMPAGQVALWASHYHLILYGTGLVQHFWSSDAEIMGAATSVTCHGQPEHLRFPVGSQLLPSELRLS